KAAKRLAQMAMGLQVVAECLSDQPRAYNQHMLRTQPALDSFQIMALHDLVQGEDAEKSKRHGANKRKGRNLFLAGEKDQQHREDGGEKQTLQRPDSRYRCGVKDAGGIQSLPCLADER